MIQIREYIDANGRNRYAMWFDRLPAPAAARVSTVLYRIELGNLSSVKNLGGGVFESRNRILRPPAAYGANTNNNRNRSTSDMALTRHFKETIQARLERDPDFRKELLKEGIDSLLSGDVDIAKVVLRDYINASIGFRELGEQTGKSPKSLMRMFSPGGNPSTQNLFAIIGCLQKYEGVQFKVQSVPKPNRPIVQVSIEPGF